jgi:hypothetical protein
MKMLNVCVRLRLSIEVIQIKVRRADDRHSVAISRIAASTFTPNPKKVA